MQSFQIKHSSKSLCVVYVLVRQVDTGAAEERLYQKLLFRWFLRHPEGVVRTAGFLSVLSATVRKRSPGHNPDCVEIRTRRYHLMGEPQDVCRPQTDHGFPMFRKIITYQPESGHVIGQS